LAARTAVALLATASVLAFNCSDARGAIITLTDGTNHFVDATSANSAVTYSGSAASQVLEVRASVRFMKADGQSYGVNNGGTPYYNEIEFLLTSPEATTTGLISPGDFDTGLGTGGFGFSQINFRAGSGYDVVNIDPNTPQAGDFRPTGDLRVFDNEVVAGTWTLSLRDTVAQDGLSVDRFRLRIWAGDPQATVAGATDFGDILVGTTFDTTVSVSNTGDTRTIQNDTDVVSTLLTGLLNDPSGSGDFLGLGSSSFGNLAVGAAPAERDYRFIPKGRGASTATVLVATDGGDQTLTLTGQGVAPQAQINTSAADAGQVRIGDTGTATVSLTNVGDGNLSGQGALSNLNGSLTAASGSFAGSGSTFSLADGDSSVVDYTYSPTVRGGDTQTVTLNLTNGSPDGTNSPLTQSIVLTGQGVGPEFTSTGDIAGTLDFGDVTIGEGLSLPLTLGNDTPDGDLGPLTDLSLLSMSITGTHAEAFSLAGFAPTVLSATQSLGTTVSFNPASVGLQQALLTIATDQAAAFGAAGLSFTFTLLGQGLAVNPEPSTGSLMLMSLALFAFGCRRRRRSVD
jgi:hypothetical protein